MEDKLNASDLRKVQFLQIFRKPLRQVLFLSIYFSKVSNISNLEISYGLKGIIYYYLRKKYLLFVKKVLLNHFSFPVVNVELNIIILFYAN